MTKILHSRKLEVFMVKGECIFRSSQNLRRAYILLFTFIFLVLDSDESRAFSRRPVNCIELNAIGEIELSRILRNIVACRYREPRFSFILANLLLIESKRGIMSNYNYDQELIIYAFNGLDTQFFEELQFRKEGNEKKIIEDIMQNNLVSMKDIFSRYKISSDYMDCLEFDKNKQCYESLRRYFDLPSSPTVRKQFFSEMEKKWGAQK
jgi:hypothetical protein